MGQLLGNWEAREAVLYVICIKKIGLNKRNRSFLKNSGFPNTKPNLFFQKGNN